MDTMTAAFNLVRDYPGGAASLAHVVGKNPATLSHEVNPKYPTAKFGLADAVTLSIWTQDRRVLSAFASEMGCMLVPLPDSAQVGNSFEALSRMSREFAELVGEVSEAVADGRVSPNELARVQGEASQLVASVEATVRHLAAMAEKQRGRVAAANEV